MLFFWLLLVHLISLNAAILPLPACLLAPLGFTRLTQETTGLNFTNDVPEARQLTNQLLLDGSGVALGDVDGDGRPDLVAGNWGRNSVYELYWYSLKTSPGMATFIPGMMQVRPRSFWGGAMAPFRRWRLRPRGFVLTTNNGAS